MPPAFGSSQVRVAATAKVMKASATVASSATGPAPRRAKEITRR
jgi:hypothetical protein